MSVGFEFHGISYNIESCECVFFFFICFSISVYYTRTLAEALVFLLLFRSSFFHFISVSAVAVVVHLPDDFSVCSGTGTFHSFAHLPAYARSLARSHSLSLAGAFTVVYILFDFSCFFQFVRSFVWKQNIETKPSEPISNWNWWKTIGKWLNFDGIWSNGVKMNAGRKTTVFNSDPISNWKFVCVWVCLCVCACVCSSINSAVSVCLCLSVRLLAI